MVVTWTKESPTSSVIAPMRESVRSDLPSDFGKLIAEETEKWGKVVKLTGAKPD
jgi:hypothetical protein